MNEANLAEYFEGAAWHCEHPFSDLNVIGKYALSKVATDAGFKVCQLARLHSLIPDKLENRSC